MLITQNTKIPFSKYRGTKLRDLPDGFLVWMESHLKDTDFHDWAVAGATEIARRSQESIQVKSLEQQADELLRSAGYNPKRL